MRAMICRQWGGPEDLRLETVESAVPKPGQARIEARAAGVSFATTLVIAGKYQRRPPFPFAPGTEISGVVTEVDAACKRLKVGDEVVAVLDWGGLAEEAVAHEVNVFPKPGNVGFVEAIQLAISYPTSGGALTWPMALDVRKGQPLLVHAAAGGVGMAVEGRICPIGFAGGTIPQIPANILLIRTLAVTGFNYGYYVGWSPHDARFEELFPGELEVELAVAVEQDTAVLVADRAAHIHRVAAADHGLGLECAAGPHRRLEVALVAALLLEKRLHRGAVDSDVDVHLVGRAFARAVGASLGAHGGAAVSHLLRLSRKTRGKNRESHARRQCPDHRFVSLKRNPGSPSPRRVAAPAPRHDPLSPP